MAHIGAARTIAEAFKNKQADYMELLVTNSNTKLPRHHDSWEERSTVNHFISKFDSFLLKHLFANTWIHEWSKFIAKSFDFCIAKDLEPMANLSKNKSFCGMEMVYSISQWNVCLTNIEWTCRKFHKRVSITAIHDWLTSRWDQMRRQISTKNIWVTSFEWEKSENLLTEVKQRHIYKLHWTYVSFKKLEQLFP